MSYSSTGSYNWLLFFLRFSALPFLCTHCSLPWCSQGQSFVAHSSQRLRRKTWQTAVLIGLQFAAVSEQLLGQSDTLAAWCPMFKTMRTRRDVWKNMFCFVYVDCQVARLSLSSGMLKPIQDASWDLPAATQSVVSDRSPYSAVWHSSPLLRKSLWAPRCETAQTEFLLPTKALCPGRELVDPPQAALLTDPHEEAKYVEMLKESEGSVCSWDMRHAINLVLGQSAPSVLLGRFSKTFTVFVTGLASHLEDFELWQSQAICSCIHASTQQNQLSCTPRFHVMLKNEIITKARTWHHNPITHGLS